MFPTHLLESELVGKSTFNVLILAGGVQVVVGVHLGKYKPVREPGKVGKAPPKPKLLPRQELPQGIPGTSSAPQISSAEGLLWSMFMEMLSTLP